MACFTRNPIAAGVILALSVPAMAADPVAMAAPAMVAAPAAVGLPDGGTIVAGNGTISSDGRDMTIQQNTDKLIANWQDFSIGADNSVTFYQPSSSSVALNRVLGQNPSEILGNLNANGQVFLVNPNGVVIGEGASVRTGAFVASSLELSDEQFLGGDYRFSGNGAGIVNQGSIDGAVVALISPNVSNEGTIKGDAALAAGTDVFLDFNGDGLLSVEVKASTVETLVENRGLIQADGGLAILTARGASKALKGVVNNTGTVQAQTLENKNGRILLLGDMDNGEANIAGTLDASAPDGGDGGFIETSAAKVSIDDSATITTAAGDGETGTWLIDPKDFTVAASGGDITGAALSSQLDSNNVEIQSVNGAAEGMGDIFVDDTITWDQNTLTLNAERNIEINTELFGSGTAGLALEYNQADAGGDYFINAPVNLASTGSFSTRNGSAGDVINYTIVTELGAEGSTTGTDLQGVDGSFVLGADIDAAATADWAGGFASLSLSSEFFDGLGHVIEGLHGSGGLFGSGINASIRHVGLVNVNIANDGDYTGALLDSGTDTRISASHATGTVTGEDSVGGLAGRLIGGSIEHSGADVRVEGVSAVGGLLGRGDGIEIRDSRADGDVLSTAAVHTGGNAGGLVGQLLGASTIGQSRASGNVEAVSDAIGGLVGASSGGNTINQSHAAGSVSGLRNVGGLVGRGDTTTITASHAEGDVSAWHADYDGSYGGGLVGTLYQGDISDSWAIGNVIVGDAGGGGLVGVSEYSSITRSYATGRVEGGSGLGGLVGRNGGSLTSGGTISQSWASGDIFARNGNAGGLVGYNVSGSSVVSQSHASGNVEGDRSGGLVGANGEGGAIEQSWSSGKVAGNYIGGLVGWIYDDGSISQSYSTGRVTPSGDTAGGLVGLAGHPASEDPLYTIDNSFYATTDSLGNTINSGAAFNDEGTGKTLAQLMDAATFASWGTDIDDQGGTDSVWRIYQGNATPLLRPLLTGLDVAVNDASAAYNGDQQTGNAGYSANADYDPSLVMGDEITGGGRNVGDHLLTLEGLYSTQHGYDLTVEEGTLTITPAALTISIGDVIKTYDGTTAAAGEAIVVGGTLYGDSLAGGTFEFTDKNAGTGKTVNVSAVTIDDGNGGGNYTVTYVHNTNSTIGRKDLTVTIEAGDKVYDSSTLASVGGDLQGVIAGDTVNLETSGQFADRHAGENKTVNISSALSGADLANYNLLANDTATANITPASLTVTAGNVSKTYDGTTAAQGAAIIAGGSLYGDDLLSGGTFNFADKHAGTGKTLTVSGVTIADGNGGNNYAVTYADNTNSTIERATLTLSAVGDSKVYDGTTVSDGAVLVDGLIEGDSLSDLGQSFDSRHVLGEGGSTLGVNGDYVLADGNGGNNYAVTLESATGTITPAGLTVTVGDITRTYDGTTAASGTAIIDAGTLFGGDSLDGASFAFADKNAGSGKTVNVSGAVIADGNGGNNYAVTYLANTNSSIDKAQLTFTGVSAEDKVYDGTTDVTLNLDALDYSVFGDDDVSLESGLSGRFADKNAGADKTVVLDAILGGVDAGNYELGAYGDLTASIARREITGSITAGDKVYDGTSTATTSGSLDGVIAGDDIDFSTSGSFADRHVGENKTITLDYDFTGADAGNYSLSGVNDTATATITAASLTIGVDDVVKTYDGTTAAAGTAIVDAGTLFGSDSLDGASFAFADKNAGSGKTVSVSNAVIADGNGGNNYDVTYVANTNSTINKAQLTFTGVTAGDKVYDGTTDAVLNLDGLDYTVFGDDDVSLESGLSGQFADKNAGDNKTVELIAALGGADAGNYQLGEYTDLTASIARREITGSITAGDKVYDGTTTAATSGSLDGVITGDTVVFDTSGSFADRHAGENKSVDLSYDFGGADAANYDLVDVNDTTSANITPATLVLSAVSDIKVHDETTISDGAVVASGLVEGDSLGNLSQSFDSAGVGNRTLLVDEGYALNDGNGGNNYQVVLESAEGRILPLVTGGGAGGLLSARRSITTADPQQNPADLLTYGPVIVNNEDPQLED